MVDDGPKQSSWFTCFLNAESPWGALSGLWMDSLCCAVLGRSVVSDSLQPHGL